MAPGTFAPKIDTLSTGSNFLRRMDISFCLKAQHLRTPNFLQPCCVVKVIPFCIPRLRPVLCLFVGQGHPGRLRERINLRAGFSPIWIPRAKWYPGEGGTRIKVWAIETKRQKDKNIKHKEIMNCTVQHSKCPPIFRCICDLGTFIWSLS